MGRVFQNLNEAWREFGKARAAVAAASRSSTKNKEGRTSSQEVQPYEINPPAISASQWFCAGKFWKSKCPSTSPMYSIAAANASIISEAEIIHSR
jgi:hypothetical protein